MRACVRAHLQLADALLDVLNGPREEPPLRHRRHHVPVRSLRGDAVLPRDAASHVHLRASQYPEMMVAGLIWRGHTFRYGSPMGSSNPTQAD